MLLDFVKKNYASTAEPHYVQPATPCPSLPPVSANRETWPLQPGPKVVASSESVLHSDSAEKAIYAVSELEKFWEENGWEDIAVEPNDAIPGLSTSLHPPAYLSSEESNEISPDDASSETSFESGSQMSCDMDDAVTLAETEEPAALETNRKHYR